MAKQYSNRSDLQNPAKKVAKQAAKGQQYGEAGRQMAAQSVVPMAAPPTEGGAPRQYARPGTIGAFGRPTESPTEPLTAGAPFGPGANPLQAGVLPRMSSETDVMEKIRAIYAMYPNDDLGNLIESFSLEGY